MENRSKQSTEAEEAKIVNAAQTIEESVRSVQACLQEEQQEYIDQLASLLEEVNSLNHEMEEVMHCVSEIDLIRREQADIERQCVMLDTMKGVTPDIWELSNRLETLESSTKAGVGISGEELPSLSSRPPAVPSPPPFPTHHSPAPPPLKSVPILPQSLKKSPPPPPKPMQSVADPSKSTDSPSSKSLPLSLSKSLSSSHSSASKSPPPIPTSKSSPFSPSSLERSTHSPTVPTSLPPSKPPIPLSTPPPRRSSSPIPLSRPPPPPPAKASQSQPVSKDSVELSPVPPRRVKSAEEPERTGESKEVEEAFVMMKPSQLRNNPLFSKLNSALTGQRKLPVPSKSKEEEVMPDLHKSFAPPPRPKHAIS